MSATGFPLQQTLCTLYNDHHGWLQSWLRKRLGCSQSAADLAQDTFAQVLAASRLPELEEPRAYLTTIAKRVLFNFWRRRDLEQAYLEALAALPAGSEPPLEDRALVFEALELIDHALGRLLPQV